MISVGDRVPAEAGLDLGPAPTLVIFFKESCSTCQIGLPVFQHWSQQVRVLGVAQDDEATTRAFFSEYGIEMEFAVDAPSYVASRAFDPDGVPALFLVEDGTVTWAGMGWSLEQANDLADRIAALDGSAPVLVGTDGLPPFRPG